MLRYAAPVIYHIIYTLHCIALHCIALHYITFITLHYITLHYTTLHYITLHYITLHYITYVPHTTHVCTYIWLMFMGNVGKYTIHGWYGYCNF